MKEFMMMFDGGVLGARKIWRKMRSCGIRCALSREKEAEQELKQTGTVAMRSKSNSVMLTTGVEGLWKKEKEEEVVVGGRWWDKRKGSSMTWVPSSLVVDWGLCGVPTCPYLVV